MTQKFALIIGAIYLVVGILGFIPGLVSPPEAAPDLAIEAGHGRLFGLFPINYAHNLVHLLIGIWGLAAARRLSNAITFSRALTIIYGALTIFGFLPGFNTLFGIAPLHGNDIWLHAGTALIAAYFGWMAPRRAI